MFRRSRQTEPDRFSVRLGTILQPLSVIAWGAQAMSYLDVPVGAGSSMIVVHDDDYKAAIEKLQSAGFTQGFPNRMPAPEIMENLPNPQQVLEEINAGYKRMDRSCAVFDYPQGDSESGGMQVLLLPSSFAHFSLEDIAETTKQYDTYGNLHYPLEPALVESFVKAAIDEEKDTGFSSWGQALISWVSLMTCYLEVNNDILDDSPDSQAIEWYSTKFGRIREAKFGPMETSRLG